jgi:bifunctional UDP-N-acetylglucosamine pyrophosphorylase/glucosamine-1-phosphate N-acetyltransferase
MSLSVIILAAGKGTRMYSRKPKVIHQLAGKPMLQHVIDTSRELGPEQIIVVIGHEAGQVRDAVSDEDIVWVEQHQQLGTGHAVMQCNDALQAGNDILVLYGDVPLIASSTLKDLIQPAEHDPVVSVLSFMAEDPSGYGRLVRDDNDDVTAIVEHKDADEAVLAIRECNSGILFIRGGEYRELLEDIGNDNVQQEYYLTDVVKHAVSRGHVVNAVVCGDEEEVLGVNNQHHLAQLESIYRRRYAERLMQQGVKLIDPERIDIRGTLEVGRDVVIDVNCVFEGNVSLGDGVNIASNCVISNTSIGAGSNILPMCVIEDSKIGDNNNIGPFARLRPLTETLDSAKIGNFVEVKKSLIGKGSKVNHLTYIGDTEMGERVNVGAGTITCNYDGAYKHKTTIEDDVFIGSDTQLVAPVKVGKGATIGAGSTITKDTPPEGLTLSRSKQQSIKNWERPRKK